MSTQRQGRVESTGRLLPGIGLGFTLAYVALAVIGYRVSRLIEACDDEWLAINWPLVIDVFFIHYKILWATVAIVVAAADGYLLRRAWRPRRAATRTEVVIVCLLGLGVAVLTWATSMGVSIIQLYGHSPGVIDLRP